MSKEKKHAIFILIIPVLIFASFFLTFRYLNSRRAWDCAIDINSGKTKMMTYHLSISGDKTLLKEKITDTLFSKLVEKYSLQKNPPEWRLTNGEESGLLGIFSKTGITSQTSYRDGRAAADCVNIAKILAMANLDDETEKKIVSECLHLLQAENLERSAIGDYAHDLQKKYLNTD